MESITELAVSHDSDRSTVQSLLEALRQVPDHRYKRGRRYEAATVLAILLLAKMSGEQTISGAAHWAKLRRDWLTDALGIEQLPCANTYSYVCAHLDVVEVNKAFREWLSQLAPERTADELEHWAIDGKMLRGSHRRTPDAVDGQEVLNVYAVDSGYLQHCEMIESKGYEAATAQEFIERTDCSGIVITADALHTRPRFVRRIRERQGHYVLVVKRNRPQLEAEIRNLFAMPPDPLYPVQRERTVDSGHGRTTVREIATSSELNLALHDVWRDAAQVFIIERHGTRDGKPYFDSVCGLTSLPPESASPAYLLELVQTHWHIENRCHWRRDATLGEDACTVRDRLVATILAVLNSLILAIFDHQKVTNARAAIRIFAAFPERALSLITQPL
jgi:predicted transposase YbfD/YdcC